MAVSDPCLVTKSPHEKSRDINSETKTLISGQESQNYPKNIQQQIFFENISLTTTEKLHTQTQWLISFIG